MALTLGLDPDTHHTGYALLDEEGHVQKVGLIRIPTVHRNGKKQPATGWTSVTMMCHRVCYDLRLSVSPDGPDGPNWLYEAAFVEVPILRSMEKANPDDIIRLGHVAGACLGAASMIARHVEAVEPKTWKGDVPKSIMCARIEAKHPIDWSCYADIPPSMRVHCIDAVGIAAWGLDKMRVKAWRS